MSEKAKNTVVALIPKKPTAPFRVWILGKWYKIVELKSETVFRSSMIWPDVPAHLLPYPKVAGCTMELKTALYLSDEGVVQKDTITFFVKETQGTEEVTRRSGRKAIVFSNVDPVLKSEPVEC